VQFFVDTGAVHDSCKSEDRLVGIIVDAEVVLLCTGERDVQNVFGGSVEDVDRRDKVDIILGRIKGNAELGGQVAQEVEVGPGRAVVPASTVASTVMGASSTRGSAKGSGSVMSEGSSTGRTVATFA
jgi:hypothetical protein